MKKLTKAKIERIKKGNAEFEKLTPKQKFLAIIKDAKTQLALGLFKERKGQYVDLDEKFDTNMTSEEMQLLMLSDHQPTCKVCARGAMMVSRCRLGNSVDSETVFDMESNTRIPGIPLNVQRVIESIFESRYYMNSGDLANALNDSKHRALYHESIHGQHSKLNAIFDNIIENDGDYVTVNKNYPGVNLTKGIWKKYDSDQKYAKKRKELKAKKK